MAEGLLLGIGPQWPPQKPVTPCMPSESINNMSCYHLMMRHFATLATSCCWVIFYIRSLLFGHLVLHRDANLFNLLCLTLHS